MRKLNNTFTKTINKNEQIMNKNKWIELKDFNYLEMIEELVEVKTEFNDIFPALPTFYDFKIENKKVVKCNKYWDGNFMFENIIPNGKITHFRIIK